MISRLLFSAFVLLQSAVLLAQPVVYKDASTLITGFWVSTGSGNSTLQEVTTATPYEGTKHYKLDYNFTAWWAGIGLNLDNWGTNSGRNFSGYTYLRIAYRGMTGGQTLSIRLSDGSSAGNLVLVGGADPSYTVITLPISTLIQGTSVNLNDIREIALSLGGVQSGAGTVYFDAIELTNSSGAPTGFPANAITWARSNAMGTGVNTSNWLEAYWLLPFNAYPELNKYNRAKVQALRSAGFSTFRLPITVERISPTTAPYTINFNQVAFRLVDSMILWANEYDFKLIIDNHHGYDLTNANYSSELPRLKALWAQLAIRYGSLDPNRYYFEVYNEATPTISNANFRTVATEIVAEIRANETLRHAVIIGASGWNSGGDLTNFTPLADSNIIYTFHNYDPYAFTHQGMSWTSPAYLPTQTFPQAGQVAAINTLFANVKTWSTTHNVPVFLGEYGNPTTADAASRCSHVQTMIAAASANSFPHFYWDAISPTDAFGFYSGGVISQSNVIPCFSSAIGLYAAPLAVEISKFEVDCRDGKPTVHWEAIASQQQTLFTVQISSDGVSWQNATTLGYTEAQHWQDSESSRYYRLKITEPGGEVSYSSIAASPCQPEANQHIYPNPVRQKLFLQGFDEQSTFAIHDTHGRVVWQSASQQITEIPVETLPSGTYYLRSVSGRGAVSAHPFVVVR
jgi:endoglucanase